MENSTHSMHAPRRRRYYGELLMPPLQPAGSSLIKSLITLSRDIIDAQITSSPCQRRNLSILSRRIKILLLFLEEVRDTASTLPPSALLCFSELHVVLQGLKLLSEDCAESSRICLLIEHRRISEFFHRLTQEMATTLEILPLPLLDVSHEVREQVELVRQQAKRAKLYVDAKEAKLYEEVRCAMGQIERKETPEVSKLSEIFNSLELRNAGDCQREMERLEAEEVDGAWDVAHARRIQDRKVSLSDLVSFVRYCKCVLYGATETIKAVSDAAKHMEVNGEEPEIKIPDDFRCPISLELMSDPVIVATGQTYDRAEITRWINGNNLTCPKSGLTLPHTTLIPNYALCNLIRQWCAQHNVHIQPLQTDSSRHMSCYASLSTPTALEATKLTVELLLRQLPLASPDMQRHIAGELRVLAKCGSDNRKVIADAGAIPLLISLFSVADARTKEHAVTAILNLSIYGPNKVRICEAGGLDLFVRLLHSQNEEVTEVTRENAAAGLFSLSQVEDAAAEMGRNEEAMEGLLKMVKEGSARGRRDAVSALFNMAVYRQNRAVLVKAGAVEVIISVLLSTDRGGIEEEGLAVLAVLANTCEGFIAAMDHESAPSALRLLVDLLRTGSSPKSKENAAAILFSLCRHGDHIVLAKVQGVQGALPSLHSLLRNGTPRARRKAASILRILLR